MELDHPLEKLHLPFDDVQKLLPGRRRRSEANEENRMAGTQSVADFAFRLEAADAWSLTSPRIHHHDRSFARVDRDTWQRHDARKRVVHRAWQRPTAHQNLVVEA